MRQSIYSKIKQITIDVELLANSSSNISLFTGISGLPIYYFLDYELTGNKGNIGRIHSSLERIILLINTMDGLHYTYCNGIAGIGKIFHFIKEKKILSKSLNKDIEEALNIIDESIVNISSSPIDDIEEIDFLHGAFGLAFYLNDRLPEITCNKMIKDVKIFFEKIAQIVLSDIKEGKKLVHITEYNEEDHKTNCGLAHGYVSYILLFAKFLTHFKKNKLIKEALRKSTEWLLMFESNNSSSFSKYPSIAVNKNTANYNTSLGWCYGDQTISLALYKASQVLNDESIKDRAFSLAYNNLKRDTIEKMFPRPFFDAGFCHGLSSIAYIHKKWHSISGDILFYRQYEKMIFDIIDFGKDDKGVAGYQKFISVDDGVRDEIGFLDGAIGIGIVLMDYLLGEGNNTNWDNFFLLDI